MNYKSLSAACVLGSALFLAGCTANQNGAGTRGEDRGNITQQNRLSSSSNNIHEDNALLRRHDTSTRQYSSYNGAGGHGSVNDKSASSYAAGNEFENRGKSHSLQIGNLVISDSKNEMSGMRPMETGSRQRFLMVNDQKSIEAIDRINELLSSEGSLERKSTQLVNDLTYILKHAKPE